MVRCLTEAQSGWVLLSAWVLARPVSHTYSTCLTPEGTQLGKLATFPFLLGMSTVNVFSSYRCQVMKSDEQILHYLELLSLYFHQHRAFHILTAFMTYCDD